MGRVRLHMGVVYATCNDYNFPMEGIREPFVGYWLCLNAQWGPSMCFTYLIDPSTCFTDLIAPYKHVTDVMGHSTCITDLIGQSMFFRDLINNTVITSLTVLCLRLSLE